MPSVKLCEDELTALYGLPHLAIVLYMLGLRPRMNYTTGTVGVRPLISWQALREAVFVEPHPGVKHEYASAKAVQRAAGWLEKAGLIRMRSRNRQLIFFLALAETDKSVQKKAGKGPGDQPGRGPTGRNPHESRVSGDSADVSREIKNQKAGRHPDTGKPVNTSPTPFTTVGEGEGVEGLIFPKSLTDRQKAAMAKKIAGVGLDMGQAVLDELEGAMQAGGVRNLPRLAEYFVNQVKTGDFMPDKGEQVRRARAAAVKAEQARQDAEQRMREAAGKSTGAGKPDLLALVGSKKRKREEVAT